jgi:hypothetical protein
MIWTGWVGAYDFSEVHVDIIFGSVALSESQAELQGSASIYRCGSSTHDNRWWLVYHCDFGSHHAKIGT